MEGVWAMNLIYDYHYGLDFAEEIGLSIKTNFDVIVQGSKIDILKSIGKGEYQQINFSAFSKKTSGSQSYDFSFDNIFKNQSTKGIYFVDGNNSIIFYYLLVDFLILNKILKTSFHSGVRKRTI